LHAPPSQRCLKSRTLSQIAMDRRIGPILWHYDQPMLHGVVPTILDMRCHIAVVPDMMFPKPPLPNPALLPRDMARPHSPLRQPARKSRLDQPPPRRKIPVLPRQSPNTMQMVRKNHPSINVKRPLRFGHRNRLAQPVHMLHKQSLPAVLQRDREEYAGTGQPWADVIRHPRI
jgi:hypothetical protein